MLSRIFSNTLSLIFLLAILFSPALVKSVGVAETNQQIAIVGQISERPPVLSEQLNFELSPQAEEITLQSELEEADPGAIKTEMLRTDLSINSMQFKELEVSAVSAECYTDTFSDFHNSAIKSELKNYLTSCNKALMKKDLMRKTERAKMKLPGNPGHF
ncbi:MAG: hypothetical protein K9I99_03820 [Melioribacteraceae bacterium]|nr:hypothetical protein [Melioribacteraceae bacterium]MCF8414561.1 hypothetical protein [Melioribacteraceae bacterium]